MYLISIFLKKCYCNLHSNLHIHPNVLQGNYIDDISKYVGFQTSKRCQYHYSIQTIHHIYNFVFMDIDINVVYFTPFINYNKGSFKATFY